MKEIEIKSRLRDKQAVISKLEKLGCVMSSPVRQIDTVYTKVIGNVEQFLSNDHFLRIREKSDGKYVFTVKVDKSKREVLIKTEHETEVKDAKELEQCLFLMGYKAANTVIKVRQTTKYNGYEICLDDVEELGHFIEVEKMVENDSVGEDVILTELREFLSSLGVFESDMVNKGYDIMIVEKMFS